MRIRSALEISISLLVIVFLSLTGAAEETLVFWSSFAGGQPGQAMDKFVRDFNATHSHLGQVKKLDLGFRQLEQKLLTALAGNVAPDLVLFNRPNVSAYSFRGAFEPWDPYLERLQLSPEDFFDHCWKEGIWEGKQYCIPFNTDVRVLFYNRRLFREAGLDPNRPPATWSELRRISQEVTRCDSNGRLKQVGFVPIGGTFGNTYFPLFAYQMNDNLKDEEGRLKVDGPGAIRAMQWIVDFVEDYGNERLRILQTAAGADELSLFLQEKTAITGDEGYLLSLIRRYKPELDFAVAPLPWPEDGVPATWSGGFGLVLPRGKRVTPLGEAFIRYLCSCEKQLEFGKISDQIPALKAAAQSPYFTEDPYWRVFVDQLQYSHSLPVSPVSMKMSYDLIKATDMATYGKTTPEKALHWVQAQIDDEWKELTAYQDNPVVTSYWIGGITVGILGFGLLVRLVGSFMKVRRMKLKRQEALWAYVMALPAILGLLSLSLAPVIVSAILSFCNYDVLNVPRWLGLDNYRTLFRGDPLFYKSLWNTVFYTFLAVPLGVALALVLALLLNQKIWFRAAWRTVFFIPSIFPIVAGSFLWLWLFNGEFGLINGFLGLLGISPVPWLTSTLWAKPALVFMSLWGVGTAMIILLAGLQSVPGYLYEAALIDGASAWQRFRHVTLPMISPTVFFVTVIGTIGSFQVFTQAYLMTDKGGPLDATMFYALNVFLHAFEYFRMGYAASLAWVLFLIIGLLTYFQFRMGKRLVHYESA